ncbi:MAG TPA: ankyrin repeat domain-containing protein, partial [Vicinamibacteria bacterium]|nr:ankyrin repeat domain-containing protein [Vicinamibacteria bacterium]
MRFRVLATALLMAIAPHSRAGEREESLRAAAAAGDIAQVRALLDAGVAIDAPARHGHTALIFAAEKGHLEVVRLLVERGADKNARERFFGSTPLQVSLWGQHRAIALFLLEKGATAGVDATLADAVERDDLELARASLASGRIERLDLLAARRVAAAKSAALRELLAAASPAAPARTAFTPRPERLRAYAGRYRVGEKGEATVAVRGDGLVVSLPGAAALELHAVAEGRFLTKDGEARVVFGGRAESVEEAEVNRGGEVLRMSVITADPKPLKVATTPPALGPAPREAARPWPAFRGQDASGIGDGQGAPLTWSVPEGRNLRFKTPVPGIALSSPVIWGDRIFVTTAVSASGDKTFRTGLYGDPTSVDDLSEHSFRLLALDKKSGAILWDREVHRVRPTVRRHLKSSQANATPATDGQRVVALFGTVGVLAAYDFGGKELWRRDLGILECNDPAAGGAQWGHASSPVLYRDKVIVLGDRVKDSFLAAFSAATGEEVWRTARDEPSTWGTPNVLRASSGDELLTNGQKIRAYDPASGALLWSLGPNSAVVVATPVVADGMAFVTAGY